MVGRPDAVHHQAPRSGEEGFTIVEMMVALSLLAVAMVALSGVFFGGLKAASATSNRTAAVALATRETEAIRAVPYDEIGFYDDQTDRVADFTNGTDRLEVQGYGTALGSFWQLSAQQVGADTVVHLGDRGTVVLVNFNAGGFDASDVLFV